MVKHKELHRLLLTWWRTEGRVLPWRDKKEKPFFPVGSSSTGDLSQLRDEAFNTYFANSLKRDPYRVIVSEMMLQQTQVDRVLPKYLDWMKKWPRIEDLAAATLSEVLIFWQGLGYNRRARFLWLLAQKITERGGVWPTTEEELRELPGIGKYTARAVQSFALEQQVGVVDTNVKRILERVFGYVSFSSSEEQEKLSEKQLFELADSILPSGQADPWNQAMMDFGALVCAGRAPKCEVCPLQEVCEVNVKAISTGFSSYRDFLEKTAAKVGRKKTTGKIKFKDTDRFFRGRIVDELRATPRSAADLKHILKENHGLLDEERFEKLTAALIKEGIISVTGNTFQVG
jgi:A/G-specific adenine glycosylase